MGHVIGHVCEVTEMNSLLDARHLCVAIMVFNIVPKRVYDWADEDFDLSAHFAKEFGL